MKKAMEGSYFLPLPLTLTEEDDHDHDHDGDSESGSGNGHINRLPDELLLLIFNKLVDAKSLCRCYLVSKRFSSIIPQIHSVSLTIPPRHSHSHSHSHSQGNKFVSFLVNNIFFRPFRYVQVSIASKCLPRQFNGPLFRAAVDSLKKFPNIQKLHIQLPPVQRHDESLLKWHAEFGNDLNICVILFATNSFRKLADYPNYESDQPESTTFAFTDSLLRTRIASANQCFSEASWRNHILRHIVEDHTSTLESVQVTDSNGDGSLISREKHVADLVNPELKLPSSGYAKVWHFQVLEVPLPLTRYVSVMEGVSVFAIRHTEVGADVDEERLDCLMDGAFDFDFDFQGGQDLYVYRQILRQRYENDVAPITLNLNVR